jgi:hypothetical protein
MHSSNMQGQSETHGITTSSLGSEEQSTVVAETKSEIDYHDGASSNHTDEEHDDPEDIRPRLERQSTELGAPIKVARLKRRGLFGQLALVAEVENPKTYPRKTKWFITFIVAVAGATAPMGSSVFYRKS